LWLSGRNDRWIDLGSVPKKAVRTEPHACSARPPNGLEVNPRGQGPRGYGSAARRMPAFEARDAGGVTPRKLR